MHKYSNKAKIALDPGSTKKNIKDIKFRSKKFQKFWSFNPSLKRLYSINYT